MKKLIYLANLRLPTEKAYGIQIAKMCEAFADGGLAVELVHPFRKNLISEDFFSYYSVKKTFQIKEIWAPDIYLSGKFDKFTVYIKVFISSLILVAYSLRYKADVVYSRDEWPLYFLTFFKKNIVFEMHNFSKARTFFYRRFFKKDIKIVVISENLKNKLLGLGFSVNNILVAHDGVDLKDFDVQLSKEEARKSLNLPQDVKIAMYTGHLFEWKGSGILAEAAKLLPDITFVFVGGTAHDINIFKKKFGNINNIIIIGYRPHKEIPIFLKAADVLVLPNSGKEENSNSPLKLFEYMAANRIIVASDLKPIREILDEDSAILVKSDDSRGLADGIEHAFSDVTKANKAFMGVQQYTWQKRAEKIRNFIK